ncbi:Peptide hydrolase [Mycena indigotica]|uniref:Peptide hydrolase n=1 Tax=Mycena indigotica TaxID=2126181 RepID=A0A8H6TDA1_9AGAR|nr:Peptide hydrolase [Mycena indigotica]KAF7316483.1 Peptide hydrolase [Mycena indigotica]
MATSSKIITELEVWSPLLFLSIHLTSEGFELDLNELRLVQFQDSEPVWITEQQKLYAKSLGMEYLDVTNLPPNFGTLFEKRRYSYPTPNSTLVASILPLISIEEMRVNLEYFTGAFETRYYNSDSGKASSEWLLKKIQEYTTQLATPQVQRLVTVKPFKHHWKQTSVIVHIQPREPIDDGITVIGAHCDSINQENPFLPAPGADDDGSGTVTILEAYRALLISGYIPTSPLEFHFYSAEEGGGLGSQDIVASYEAARKEIKGMQQYDMTAWVASGTSPVVNVVTSGVDAALSTFLCQLVDRYLDIPCVRESKRKNAGSDHLLWNRAGYQACHAAEGLMGNENYDNIHTAQDRIDVSPEFSFEHINEFAKLAVAFAVELSS